MNIQRLRTALGGICLLALLSGVALAEESRVVNMDTNVVHFESCPTIRGKQNLRTLPSGASLAGYRDCACCGKKRLINQPAPMNVNTASIGSSPQGNVRAGSSASASVGRPLPPANSFPPNGGGMGAPSSGYGNLPQPEITPPGRKTMYTYRGKPIYEDGYNHYIVENNRLVSVDHSPTYNGFRVYTSNGNYFGGNLINSNSPLKTLFYYDESGRKIIITNTDSVETFYTDQDLTF